ncbi:MAG TPA: 23S rRNA (pseudouridine(1915)-N(3))-methyltransferase RlmH [Blastocatellia bacterium]|nr:23S rRNA (pseudouridine(1915)-N(3))-methyltransferase RlmH [Blastocatellia bacterium]
MKLRFIWIGKTKSAPVRQLIEDFVGRIGKFGPVEVTELRDREGGDRQRIIEGEGEEILARAGSVYLIVLDERGQELDSVKFAELIEKQRLAGTKQIAFVIGGRWGMSQAVRARADFLLSLSRMTLTHELARVFLVEQVYRAFTIIHDLPYQK